MIIMHPNNLKRFSAAFPTAKLGECEPIPVHEIQIKTDVMIPETRKTGRLIWQQDPFVTYEDSDREWGLALGFCTEEEEPVYFEFTPPEFGFELEMQSTYKEFKEQMEVELARSLCVPSSILSSAANSSYSSAFSEMDYFRRVTLGLIF